jgi:hypothetical protein
MKVCKLATGEGALHHANRAERGREASTVFIFNIHLNQDPCIPNAEWLMLWNRVSSAVQQSEEKV